MELNQENIEEVVEVLRMGKFNEAMKDVSDYFVIAKELIEKYPDLTAEQIGEEYEKQCEVEKEQKETQTMEEK